MLHECAVCLHYVYMCCSTTASCRSARMRSLTCCLWGTPWCNSCSSTRWACVHARLSVRDVGLWQWHTGHIPQTTSEWSTRAKTASEAAPPSFYVTPQSERAQNVRDAEGEAAYCGKRVGHFGEIDGSFSKMEVACFLAATVDLTLAVQMGKLRI